MQAATLSLPQYPPWDEAAWTAGLSKGVLKNGGGEGGWD